MHLKTDRTDKSVLFIKVLIISLRTVSGSVASYDR